MPPKFQIKPGVSASGLLIGLVAVVEEDGVAVRVAEPGPMADARVPHLIDLHAGRPQLRLRLGDIGDAQGKRSGRQRRDLVLEGLRRRRADVAAALHAHRGTRTAFVSKTQKAMRSTGTATEGG